MSDAAADDDSEDYCPGSHEVQEEVAQAGGFLSSYRRCRKHPNHRDFYSVDEFGLDKLATLPSCFRSEEIVRFVKIWADLVVRISVVQISPHRPDGYPLSRQKGQKVRNSGSGWMQNVYGPCEGLCLFGDCDKPTRHWQIQINTARHVVFDGTEAKDCEVVFFDDRPDGIGSERVAGCLVSVPETEADYCTLLCHTHDENLGKKLVELRDRSQVMEERTRQIINELCCARNADIDDCVTVRLKELHDRMVLEAGKSGIGARLKSSLDHSDETISDDDMRRLKALSGKWDELDFITRQRVKNLYRDWQDLDNNIRKTLKEVNELGCATERNTKQLLKELYDKHDVTENRMRQKVAELYRQSSMKTEDSRGEKAKLLTEQWEVKGFRKSQLLKELCDQCDVMNDDIGRDLKDLYKQLTDINDMIILKRKERSHPFGEVHDGVRQQLFALFDKRDETDDNSRQTLKELCDLRLETHVSSKLLYELVNDMVCENSTKQSIKELVDTPDEVYKDLRLILKMLDDRCEEVKDASINYYGYRSPMFVISPPPPPPHGRMKYITVGDYKGRVMPVVYTAATCPGSSGGLVLYLGARVPSKKIHLLGHSGHLGGPALIIHNAALSRKYGQSIQNIFCRLNTSSERVTKQEL